MGDPTHEWAITLQTYVSHLRRPLEPDRSRGAAGGVLVTRNRPVVAARTTSRNSTRRDEACYRTHIWSSSGPA